MTFLDTEPAAIDRLGFAGPWDRFRVSDPRRLWATLRELCKGDAPLTLGQPGGRTLRTSLWSVDDLQGRLHLNVSGGAEHLSELAALPELWGAAYLSDAKVQFCVRRIRPTGSEGKPAVCTNAPHEMYHLPRRRAVRVRRAAAHTPMLRFAHPLMPEVRMALRVRDISTSGCAVWSQPGDLPLAPGTLVREVELELDAQTFVFTDLSVQHVALDGPHGGPPGRRVGCAWRGLPLAAQETLQCWIRGGRRRRELVSLSLD